MKIVVLAQVEIEIPDGSCPGCAAESFKLLMSSLYSDGEFYINNDDNCQRNGEETFVIPRQIDLVGMQLLPEDVPQEVNGETMH